MKGLIITVDIYLVSAFGRLMDYDGNLLTFETLHSTLIVSSHPLHPVSPKHEEFVWTILSDINGILG